MSESLNKWPRPVITPIPDYTEGVFRHIIDLNGTWKFALNAPENFWAAYTDYKNWLDIQVPGECVMQGYDIKQDKEYAYMKQVTIPSDFTGKRIILRFDGVYSYARVWVNGTYVRDHEGGFTSWECDITDLAIPGQPACIVVGITDRSNDISRGTFYAQHNMGGIIRDVKLIAVPEDCITRFHVETDFDSTYTNSLMIVSLAMAFKNKVRADIELSLTDPRGRVVETQPYKTSLSQSDNEALLKINVDAPLKWDAEHPNLYTLNADVLVDGRIIQKLSKKIGFRKVEVRGNKVFVNGREIKLRGVNRHDVHPVLGRASDKELEEKDIQLFKDANINFIRTSHYPPSENLLDMCDRYGMYVEEEAAVCWVHIPMIVEALKNQDEDRKMGGSEYTPKFLDQFSEMIERDKSHPSVIIWSLGNESIWNANFAKEREYASLEDPLRPVIFSFPALSLGNGEGAPADGYDIYSHHYCKWYEPMVFDHIKKPVLHDEAIHVSTHNRKTLSRDPNVRDYWGLSVKKFWEYMFNTEGCLGNAIWAATDEVFHLPDNIKGDEITLGRGEWGIIDGWRRQKPEYWHTKKAFSPIYIDESPLQNPGPRNPLKIPVTNRFDHANLSEVDFMWNVGGDSGKIDNVDIEPHASGLLTIPARDWKLGDVLHLKCIFDNRLVDEYRLTIGRLNIDFNNKKAPAPDIYEDSEAIIVSSGSIFKLVFNKATGQIAEGIYKGNSIIAGGPYINLTPHPLSQWSCTGISFFAEDNKAVIDISGSYGSIKVDFTIKIDGSGLIETTYRIINPPPPMTENHFEAFNEGYTEVGVAYELSPSIDRITWNRKALWSVYPDDHIGRSTGVAYKNREEGIEAYRTKPQWSWSSDIKNYLLFGRDDDGVRGTNDFRSMKENIWYASGVMSGSEDRVRVESDGFVSLRAEIMKDSGNVRLNINNVWSYQSLSVNNYIPVQTIENGYTNTVCMRFVDNDDCVVCYTDDDVVLVDDTDPLITYKTKGLFNADLSIDENKGSMWINCSSGDSYKGTLKYSNYPGDYVEFAFFGTAIKWIGPKGGNFGKADVYIDGEPAGEVDCYSEDGWTDRQVLYSRTGLAYGKHTVRIVVKGEKNPLSSDKYVGIDAFEYKTR